MNIIFCTSPFQVLIAKEVVQTVSEDFIGIYLKMSNDARQTFYAERMKEFCKEVIVLEGKTVLNDIQEILKGRSIRNLYLASLDNPVALSIFKPSTMSLYTFDEEVLLSSLTVCIHKKMRGIFRIQTLP